MGRPTPAAPIVEGSIITVDHLPGELAPKPMWLWCSDATPPTLTWTGGGVPTCAASTLNTLSAS
jgi:hypothetical protein